MPIQYTNELLGLPELTNIQLVSVDSEALHLEAQPVDHIQCCPICQSMEHLTRKGRNCLRNIRHLAAFDKKTYLHVPSIRMACSAARQTSSGFMNCGAQAEIQSGASFPDGRTVPGFVSGTQRPDAASSCQHRTFMHNEAVPVEAERIYEQVWDEAQATDNLVLGVDDFPSRKGTPTIRAFIISKEKPCWTSYGGES